MFNLIPEVIVVVCSYLKLEHSPLNFYYLLCGKLIEVADAIAFFIFLVRGSHNFHFKA